MILVVNVFTKIVTNVESLREMVLVLEDVDVARESCVADDCDADADDPLLPLLAMLTVADSEGVLDRVCDVEAPTRLALPLVDAFWEGEVDRVSVLPLEVEVSLVVIVPDNVSELVDNDPLPLLDWVCEFDGEGNKVELLFPVAPTVEFSVDVVEKVPLVAVVRFTELAVEVVLVIIALPLSIRGPAEVLMSDPVVVELTVESPEFEELVVTMELFCALEAAAEMAVAVSEVEVSEDKLS